MESQIETYTLTDLTSIPEPQIPSLCEVWNWQGDTSWTEVLNATAGQEEAYDTKYLKANYISSSKFNPDAFFFLTYRSHAIGLCLAWPAAENEFEIKHLTSVPSHRNKGVEEALISLVLGYIKEQGGTKVVVKLDEPKLKDFQKSVIVPILGKFGFSN
ncbi:UNKNOWN [Stylonychia lemnae]|uniref:N-acetyltransferase domain-containing protein n=1 Tax=Stylonychia lemnae TaxID=5949 RepID=A0A077ZVP8_STYLE|nr:UNKNOWN [Stylonychia lemnae]|eukprot:CDW72511.1 UNKNOWN [Stylonychia lemnae]